MYYRVKDEAGLLQKLKSSKYEDPMGVNSADI